MKTIRVFPGLVLAFAVACGGGGSSPSTAPKLVPAGVIRQAFAKTIAAKTARVSMIMEITSPDEKGSITGSGVFDFTGTRGLFTFDFTNIPGTPFSGKIEQRIVERVLYMKIPGLGGGTKTWLKLDVDALAKVSGVDLSELSQLQSQDPTQTLAFLEAVSGDVRRLGTGKVRGVETTQYAATIDIKKAAATLPEKLRSRIESMRTKLHMTSLPIQVWIDADQLLRRMAMVMDLSSSRIPGAEQGTVKISMDVFDYGAPVNVKAPPANQVADFAEVLGSLK